MLQSALMFQLSQINVFRLVGEGGARQEVGAAQCYDLLPPGRRRGGKGRAGHRSRAANCKRYIGFHNHGERPYKGLLLVAPNITSPMDRLQLYTGASLVSTQLVQCCL